jgi:hypothetical protein
VNTCEYNNKILNFINVREFSNELNDYQLIKKNFLREVGHVVTIFDTTSCLRERDKMNWQVSLECAIEAIQYASGMRCITLILLPPNVS